MDIPRQHYMTVASHFRLLFRDKGRCLRRLEQKVDIHLKKQAVWPLLDFHVASEIHPLGRFLTVVAAK